MNSIKESSKDIMSIENAGNPWVSRWTAYIAPQASSQWGAAHWLYIRTRMGDCLGMPKWGLLPLHR